MRNDSILGWGLRLLLTVALVGIGAWLCPFFHVYRCQGVFFWSLLILSFAAGTFAAVLLLRLVLKAGVPLRRFVSMGLLVSVVGWLLSLLLASFLSVRPLLGISFSVQDSFAVLFEPSMALLMICVRFPWFLVLPWLEWPIVLLPLFRRYDPHKLSLQELPEGLKVGPLGTAIFLAAALIPLILFAYEPFLSLVSGRFLSDRVIIDPSALPDYGLLTPERIKFGVSEFLLLAAVVFPHIAAARWMSDRSTRLGFIVFAVCTGALRLCMLCILVQPLWWLIQYSVSTDFTYQRVCALLFGLLGCFIIMGYKADWLNLLPFGHTRKVQAAD